MAKAKSVGVFDGEKPVLLDGPHTMLGVLTELAGEDALTYRGMVDVWNIDPEQPARWRLEINDNKGNSVSAVAGQYIAKIYGRLLVLDAAEVEGAGS